MAAGAPPRGGVRPVLCRGLERVEFGLCGQNIARQVQLYGPAAWRKRLAIGLSQHLWHAVCAGGGPGLFGDGLEQRILIHLLKGIAIAVTTGQSACNTHHRGIGRLGLCQPGHKVCGARPVLPRQDDTRLPAHPRKAISHMSAGAFIMYADKLNVRGIIKRVKHLHCGRSNQAKDMGCSLSPDRLNRSLATCHFCHS